MLKNNLNGSNIEDDATMRKRVIQKLMLILTFAASLLIPGCASSSSKIEFDHQPYEPIINAETLTIEPVSINDALRSNQVIKAAVDYFKPYVSGNIEVLGCNNITLELNKNSEVSAQQLYELVNSRKRFGETFILIVICPDIDFFHNRGFYQFAQPTDNPQTTRHFVFINARTCNKTASAIPFASVDNVTSLVIFHELCHSLRVPARINHAKKEDEGHCSNANCILYPKIDFNSALNAMFHFGPPHSLCKMCREEVFAMQSAKK